MTAFVHMKTNKDNLSRRQDNALAALLQQPTIAEAANAAGVSERTLRRWLDEPAFTAAYRNARLQAFGLAVTKVQQLAVKAVEILGQVMQDPATPAHAKVSAVTSLLRFGREGVELEDITARLSQLESTLASRELRGAPR